MSLSKILKKTVQTALESAFPETADKLVSSLEVTPSTQSKFGHYQCNSAMRWAKILGQPPRGIAEAIVTQINESKVANQPFSQIDIAGPGFINFTFTPDYLAEQVRTLLTDPALGIEPAATAQTLVLDYSHPNIAKEMHVGHLRSTIIGEALARLFEFLGHRVLRLNHFGDWGTQFGMLIAYLKAEYPDTLDTLCETLSLGDLMQAYRASKARFDADLDFKETARKEVVALQAGEPNALQIWKTICEISERGYQPIYDLLNTHLIPRGESFYNPFLADLIQTLEDKKLITESDGAKCVFLEGFQTRDNDPLPLIVQKADGGFNYATTDLAAIQHRVQVEKADALFYVVDAGQAQHFKMCFETAQKAGLYDPKHTRLEHVAFGYVLREDGKRFKTREGDTERLIDLLNKAIEKAKAAILAKNPEQTETTLAHTAQVLGINAVKYADLSTHRTSDYRFSYDRMLQFEGNTAAFLMYAYVRIQGIKRKTGVDVTTLNPTTLRLSEPNEIALARQLCQFADVIESIEKDLMPHRLCEYLFELAEAFHAFFHQCRVEGSDAQSSRLLLCEATAKVLKQGLFLLGLETLEKM